MNTSIADLPTNEVDLVVFTVDNVMCALRIDEVQEIKRVIQITNVPKAPDYVSGVVNLRGQIVTVIDLRKKLNYNQGEINSSSRIVVVKRISEQIGLLVDTIEDAVVAHTDELLHSPSNIKGAESRFFKGVYQTPNALVSIIDIEALLEKDEKDKGLQ
jgi:purine-binding chemotaxis protein CheW